MVQRIVMGGVGTVSMTLDEINGLVQRLVGRGESVEAELTELVQEYVDQRSANGVIDLVPAERGREGEHDPAAAEADAGTSLAPLAREATALERSVETILVRLNVPTRTDIEELSHKIAVLNDKVTRLRDARTSAAGARAMADTAAQPEHAAAVPQQRRENGKGS
jgi:poly(hydroxyalkanoate) granule-associated protein